ncbi:hypothetical protein ACHQM5_028007 [Ranunculus cassubicifolius]
MMSKAVFLISLVLVLLQLSNVLSATQPCNGTLAECNEEDEFLMDSEISRRILAQGKYISPGALKNNQPTCGGNGNSYSRCLPRASNPQTKVCAKYFRCRGG